MSRTTLWAGALLMVSPAAFAHTPAETGLSAGLIHALTGFDHMLAMLALGIWASCMKPAASRMLSIGLPLMLVAGLALGMSVSLVAAADMGIALSLVLLGGLIASRMQYQGKALLPASAAMLMAAAFVMFHGVAHTEAVSGPVISFATGLLLTSVALQRLGLVLGNWMSRRLPAAFPVTGALLTVAGAALIAG